ncbi:PLDc N-terminal domain-containing protein [uncultured Corynebacterium sp.]|uniref:PLDc N-terminal domain-containing protein n=1 Tax=uncultured Corynebacterium sp. TaxID=159447 RepID=UPI0025D9650E|nr:PLDc N-terminal domain-containing protein [uncultured Corynebacterium sp.]
MAKKKNIDLKATISEWKDMSLPAKIGVGSAIAAELAAKVGMWRDLATRPADQVRGPKWLWFILSFVNTFGPGAYYAFGRKK